MTAFLRALRDIAWALGRIADKLTTLIFVIGDLTDEISKLRADLRPDLRAVTWTVGDPQEEMK